jgi:hypothetical protein
MTTSSIHLTHEGDTWTIHAEDGLGGKASTVLPQPIVDELIRQAAALHRIDWKGLQVAITLHREANIGDHAEVVTKALPYDPTETVAELAVRAFGLGPRTPWGTQPNPQDRLTLQYVDGTEPPAMTAKDALATF